MRRHSKGQHAEISLTKDCGFLCFSSNEKPNRSSWSSLGLDRGLVSSEVQFETQVTVTALEPDAFSPENLQKYVAMLEACVR